MRGPRGLPGGQAVQTLSAMRCLAAAATVLSVVACQRSAPPEGRLAPNQSVSDGGTAPVPLPPPPDAGTPDAGPPPDAGPNPHRIGGMGPGPFPSGSPIIYGSAPGVLEAPISAAGDEGEKLWGGGDKARYLMAAGWEGLPP